MRLRTWVKRAGKGEIARIAHVTGASYRTVHELARDKRKASYATAKLVSAATGGAVSITELCELPRVRKRKR
jgi:hypothetical protein